MTGKRKNSFSTRYGKRLEDKDGAFAAGVIAFISKGESAFAEAQLVEDPVK